MRSLHPLSFPYACSADRNDIVWFSEIFGNRIGRFDPKTQKVDLRGKILIPEFADSHFHLVSSALALQKLQLTFACHAPDKR